MDRDQQREAARAAAAFTATPAKIEVPSWGGEVWVRRISVAMAIENLEEAKEGKTDSASIARNLARRICDAAGALTFDPDSADDIALLAGQGDDWLYDVTKKLREVDSPKKPSAPSASS